jgi:PTS system cellobiose-specific IIC component
VLACFFNINEPLIFGAPIVFNPLLALPFVGITAINTIVAYLAHSLDWVSATVAFVPWILPTPVLTFLASSYDVRAGMLGLVTWLIIPGIVWLPFFRRWEQQVIAAESA